MIWKKRVGRQKSYTTGGRFIENYENHLLVCRCGVQSYSALFSGCVLFPNNPLSPVPPTHSVDLTQLSSWSQKGIGRKDTIGSTEEKSTESTYDAVSTLR